MVLVNLWICGIILKLVLRFVCVFWVYFSKKFWDVVCVIGVGMVVKKFYLGIFKVCGEMMMLLLLVYMNLLGWKVMLLKVMVMFRLLMLCLLVFSG